MIENIPVILSYIVYGYIFLAAYNWISFKDDKNFKNLIIKSVVVSYILQTIYDIIAVKYNVVFASELHKALSYFACSAILGFVIGRIITHRWFNFLLNKLHVGRTTNTNIWDDVIRPQTWLRVFMKDGSSYLGQFRYGEPFASEPIIVLGTYQKLNKDVDVVIDNTQNPNEYIMLNTKDFDRIEITYTEQDDSHVKTWSKIKTVIQKIFRK